jgi:hypothetical protein
MNTIISLKRCFAMGSVAASFISLADAPDPYAGCYSTYTSDTTKCSNEQQSRDYSSWSNYIGIVYASVTNLQAIQLNDYNTEVSTANGCASTLDGNKNTCRNNYHFNSDYSYDFSFYDTAYNNDMSDCANNYPNDDDARQKCECNAYERRTYNIAMDGIREANCENVYYAGYQKCVDLAVATQFQSDNEAAADAAKINWSAYADWQKAQTLSKWVRWLCDSTAGTALNNCILSINCNIIPPNCCVDGCTKTYNSDALAAYANYNSKVGSAEANEVYKIYNSYATQLHDDFMSYADIGANEKKENASYTYNNSLAQTKMNKNIFSSRADRELAIGQCQCNNDPTADCTSGPTATCDQQEAGFTKDYNDKYGNPNGTEYVAHNSRIDQYETDLQHDYSKHQATYDAATDAARTAYKNISDSASVSYNNAMNAAGNNYVNCLNGCNQG